MPTCADKYSMNPTLNEKFLAYLALFSGLTLSIVAEYYSILGLMAIFAAAPWSVVVMGIALGIGKISATLWLKQNWTIAPWTIRSYLLTAIAVLMLITSMGIFGFLSKAHSDQSLVSGDVQSKIAVYDEKIKTARDNIDVNRKALKQMDEAVDQVMGRSQDEKGADKAVALRRAQQKERARLQSEIQAEQKTITGLTEERAPIAADVRKIEAEVGPIKYIAQFVYGESDKDLLEKAVTWVIIILIVVFDPLAVILLLASQISFQDFRERKKKYEEGDSPDKDSGNIVAESSTVTNQVGIIAQEVGTLVTEAVTNVDELVTVSYDEVNSLLAQAKQELEEKRQREIEEELARDQLVKLAKTYIPEESILQQDLQTPIEPDPIHCVKCNTELTPVPGIGLFCTNNQCDVGETASVEHKPTPIKNISNLKPKTIWQNKKPASVAVDITEQVVQTALEETHEVKNHGSGQYVVIDGQTYNRNSMPERLSLYVQNEEQKESNVWSSTVESKKD